MTEEKLNELCSKYGVVTSCQLKQMGPQFKKAQVAFATKDDCANALQKLYKEDLGDKATIDLYMDTEGRKKEP